MVNTAEQVCSNSNVQLTVRYFNTVLFLLAYSCRTRIIGHLAQRFATVSDAESHFGIDLEASDEDDQSTLAAIASPIRRRTVPAVKKTKGSQNSVGVQADFDSHKSIATATMTTQTESLQSQLADMVKSQPLSFQV